MPVRSNAIPIRNWLLHKLYILFFPLRALCVMSLKLYFFCWNPICGDREKLLRGDLMSKYIGLFLSASAGNRTRTHLVGDEYIFSIDVIVFLISIKLFDFLHFSKHSITKHCIFHFSSITLYSVYWRKAIWPFMNGF